MGKTSLRITWWTITLLYVAFIYVMLGIAQGLWDKINTFLGGRNDFLLVLFYSLVGTILIFYVVFIKKERSVIKYIILTLFTCAFYFILKFTWKPAERMHMGEYGILGIILYNALKIDFDRFDKRLYLFGALICIAVGVVDEFIQRILPNRLFDWRDIFMNGASGILALLVIRINILKKQIRLL